MNTRIAIVTLAIMLLAACANRPVPLAVETPPVNDVQLAEVIRAPADFTDADVRWGGTILSSERRGDRLRVQVLQRFLEENGRPDPGGPSDGRFFADVTAHEDTDDYSRGRFITVAGTLQKPVQKQINEQTEQTLPLVAAREHYTWRNHDRNRDHYRPYHRFPPYMPFYGPYYYPPYYHPYYHHDRGGKPGENR